MSYAALSPEGEELRALQNRMTWARARRGGGRRVVHEHSTSPAALGTGKVILTR